MRIVTVVLAVLLALVHVELWFGKVGVGRMVELTDRLAAQRDANQVARGRNAQLAAEVNDLKEGLEMVEEKARHELGMIKPDEIFVQLAPPPALNALLETAAPLLASAFALWGAPVTWLEIVAFALAIAMVVANMRVAPVAWPLAIASSLLYFLLFWQSRLYGEASLQIFFVAVAFWGWWQWLRGTDAAGRALRVRPLSTRGRVFAIAALAIAWPAVALFLDRFSDSDVPWSDALPTAGSVLGQWLLAKKYVENWPVWLAVNVASVALFAGKGLWLTVLLYAVFVVMSAFGWRAWQRLARA